MPKIRYQEFNFRAEAQEVIRQANSILSEYSSRGLIVTLRQLYYQFVARDLIKNKQSEYKRLGSIINDARLAGLVDWSHLQDRTRNLQSLSHWSDPSGIIYSASKSYRRNLWEGQKQYVECWIEKDALLGVIEDICNRWDVPYFSCRGYTSQSEMWGASQRLLPYMKGGRRVTIVHLGDHDPSGKDMSRDIEDRLRMFTNRLVEVNRIALNMDQVEQYNPPPNPAKLTDVRATKYIAEYGDESWELDALPPDSLVELIEEEIKSHLDLDLYDSVVGMQEKEREVLIAASERWTEVAEWLEA